MRVLVFWICIGVPYLWKLPSRGVLSRDPFQGLRDRFLLRILHGSMFGIVVLLTKEKWLLLLSLADVLSNVVVSQNNTNPKLLSSVL